MNADIRTLEILAAQIEKDARHGRGLNSSALMSVADIIKRAIGAPLMWPARAEGVRAADDWYPGSPDLRLAWNGGVKWAVENYSSTELISNRFGVLE